MAYSTSAPPILMVPSIGAKPALWVYSSTHTSTGANAAGFFTNGKDLGMKAADLVAIYPSTGAVAVWGTVSAVSSTGATVITT